MFSTGQLIFTIIFFIIFVFVIIFSYRGDKKIHKKYYKNNIWVLICFVIFIALILTIKFLVGN